MTSSSHWSQNVTELPLPFKQPRPWELSLDPFGKGIDNAHIDVYLSPRLTSQLRTDVRRLLLEELNSVPRQNLEQPRIATDLESFRKRYVGLFEATIQRSENIPLVKVFPLLQLSLLKTLLEGVAGEIRRLRTELKSAAHREESRSTTRRLDLNDQLVSLTRQEGAIFRRVLDLLFRQVRQVEGSQLRTLRASVTGREWPIPEQAFFNPVLLASPLSLGPELASSYPIAWLSDSPDNAWLLQTNQCICKVLQHHLPPWTRERIEDANAVVAGKEERRDQGQLRGFLETEMLLRRFLSPKEYELGRVSWLDEPENLRLFLSFDKGGARSNGAVPDRGDPWSHPHWVELRRAVRAELFHCLDMYGLSRRITLVYLLPAIQSRLGRPLPLSLLEDYVDGRLPRRRVAQRLEALGPGLDPNTVQRVLDLAAFEVNRLSPTAFEARLERYLVDFLTLRRDLKLAFWTYRAMDEIRLIEDPEEVRLSRSNASLHEFFCPDELGPTVRRIRSHVVIKADLRGSTPITERLRAQGLNPASHFSRNFFEPVNKLLTDYGAEKVFVEGDAVILAIFEHEGDGTGLSVARGCGLAHEILRVVSLQNLQNRKHGLPELELGLGIAFSPKEPNFLFDDGRRIMISGAISRADRLSACSSALRRHRVAPANKAFRVVVLREKSAENLIQQEEDLLSYNVNGVRIEETAFLKLQNEVSFQQVRPKDAEDSDELFLCGSYPDLAGRTHWLVIRYAPVREWDGESLGAVDQNRRHFFEVIVDEPLRNRIRKLLQA